MPRSITMLAVLALTTVACQPSHDVAEQPDSVSSVPAAHPAPDLTGDSLPSSCRVQEGDHRQRALIQFVAEIRSTDLQWLCEEGFGVEEVFEETGSARVRVPDGYVGNLHSNARVKRFDVLMR